MRWNLIAKLPEARQAEVIAQIEDEERVQDIQETAYLWRKTRQVVWWQKNWSKSMKNWTVTKCMREMRTQASEVKRVHSIYVVDDENKTDRPPIAKRLTYCKWQGQGQKAFYIPKVDYVNISEQGERSSQAYG